MPPSPIAPTGWLGSRAFALVATLALTIGPVVALAPQAADAASAVTPSAAVEEPLTRDDCPVEVPAEHADRVTCWELVVPESRAEGSDPEKTIRLPVAVVASRNPEPSEDPLVFPTSGGPGGGSFSALWWALDYADWAAADRDIILIEQRGDAVAEPSLRCPELDTEHFIVDGSLLRGADESERRAEQLQACHARLVEEGIDLAAYTSATSAADLADLRAAMGYATWNLYGVSYGSRLAMTVMRDHPEGLRSVVLDGPFPPNVNWFESLPTGFGTALEALFAQCDADSACRDAYPDLEGTLGALLQTVDQTPLSVTVNAPADGPAVRMGIGAAEVTDGLFDALYDTSLIGALPFVIDQLALGNADVALPLAQRAVDARNSQTEGLNLSVDCAEEAPFNDDAVRDAAIAADPLLEAFSVRATFREDCATWAVPALSAIENEAVTSGIPTLIMNGGFDPVTPLPYGEAAASGLATHFMYEFPTMSHGAVWQNWVDPCPASIAQQFLTAPAIEPDSSCIAGMPAAEFLTTADIYPTSAIYRFNSDVVEDRNLVQIGIATLTIAVLIGTLVYAVIYGVAWLIRRRGGAPPGAVLTAATAAALNLAFAGGMAFVLLNTEPLVLAFGIPPAARALVIAPLVGLAVTVLLTVVVVRAWAGRDGALLHRVLLSLSALASITFAVWLIARGLIIF